MEERWEPIEGYGQRYEVSDFGRVRSCDMLVQRGSGGSYLKHGRILSPTFSYGYPYVKLCYGGEQRRVALAILVCKAFHGPKPAGMEVAHRDGDPANARSSNLRWATPAQNMADKKLHGTERFGETHPRAKISEEAAREIVRRLLGGESQHAIARAVGVSRGIVCCIAMGETWRHLWDASSYPRRGVRSSLPALTQ